MTFNQVIIFCPLTSLKNVELYHKNYWLSLYFGSRDERVLLFGCGDRNVSPRMYVPKSFLAVDSICELRRESIPRPLTCICELIAFAEIMDAVLDFFVFTKKTLE